MVTYLLIGFCVATFLVVLDTQTYPENSLSLFYILTNLLLWPFTLLTLIAVLLEAD